MNWTTEKPNRPGRYWFRPFADLTADPAMVKVYEEDGLLFVAWLDTDRVDALMHVSGEWAGPIKPPT
jgi:hypothetical protein